MANKKLIELLKDSPTLNAMDDDGYAMGADHLIANGVTVQDWISIKDRLPQKTDCYLVMRSFGVTGEREVAVFTYSEYLFPGKNMFSRCGENDVFYNNSVTHWMPLPKPPKGVMK